MPEKNKKLWWEIGIGAVVVGVILYLVLRKGSPPVLYDANGQVINQYYVPQPPNALQDTITTIANKLVATLDNLPAGTTSKSDPGKVLQFGITSDPDVKLLQQYLNNFTKARSAQNAPHVAVISVNGNFNEATAAAMQYYLQKQSLSVAELNQRIAAMNIDGSVPIGTVGF